MKMVFTLPCRHLIQNMATLYYSNLEHVKNVDVVFKLVILTKFLNILQYVMQI
jgi:hypothetical protein